jgi:hypothetical protein
MVRDDVVHHLARHVVTFLTKPRHHRVLWGIECWKYVAQLGHSGKNELSLCVSDPAIPLQELVMRREPTLLQP